MAAGDEIVGITRFVYESPVGARSKPLADDIGTKTGQQTDRHNQARLFPNFSMAMNENGYLFLQHKGGTGSQVHDSSAMTLMNIPYTYVEKSRPNVFHTGVLTNAGRNTTRLADDQGDDTANFVDIMCWLVPAGQIWFLGSRSNPETLITTESTA